MALITRKEAAEQMGVTIHAVYMAIKQGRLTAITDNQGKTVINSDTMYQEWTGKSAFRKMKNIQAATIEPPVTKRKIAPFIFCLLSKLIALVATSLLAVNCCAGLAAVFTLL